MCATYVAWCVAHKIFILANGLEGIKLYFFFSPPLHFGCAFVKQEGNTVSHNQLSDLVRVFLGTMRNLCHLFLRTFQDGTWGIEELGIEQLYE